MIVPSPRYWREIPQRYRYEAARCTSCGKVFFPPRLVCNGCRGQEFEKATLASKGTIETYTVIHDRKGPSYSILYGRLDDGSRFIANTENDPDLLTNMEAADYLGAKGRVSTKDGLNTFTPI